MVKCRHYPSRKQLRMGNIIRSMYWDEFNSARFYLGVKLLNQVLGGEANCLYSWR